MRNRPQRLAYPRPPRGQAASRNDALGNVAVMLAALGVFGTGTGWPDIIVASVMAALSLWGAGQIINHAWNELRTGEGKVLAAE